MTQQVGSESQASQGSPRAREVLEGLPAYVAGKPASGSAGGLSYKLSSNENPYPPLPGVVDAATRAAAAMNRYPDMGNAGLLHALSERFGVPADRIAVGTGSVAVLYHLLQATCEAGDEVVYAWRSFEAYPIAVQVTGATSVRVPLTAGARHDLDAMVAAITDRTRVVIACTPNNPTGPAIRRDELVRFVEAVPRDVLVVVDEAYREFIRDDEVADAAELFRDRPNVVVLRTFSKAYGLAGFRVGFAIGPEPLVAAVRKCALPFGVSHVAHEAAIASLGAEAALLERVEALVAERTRVADGLRAAGWDVPDAQGNFVWLALGDDAVPFAEMAQAEGIAVRPFAGDGVRVTIGEPEANDILLTVAEKWRS
jgi:histidinol-phosphate aminotransferase